MVNARVLTHRLRQRHFAPNYGVVLVPLLGILSTKIFSILDPHLDEPCHDPRLPPSFMPFETCTTQLVATTYQFCPKSQHVYVALTPFRLSRLRRNREEAILQESKKQGTLWQITGWDLPVCHISLTFLIPLGGHESGTR